MLDTGQAVSVQELAAKGNIDPSYLARHLRLAKLAPDIVEAVLVGEFSGGVDAGEVDGGFADGMGGAEGVVGVSGEGVSMVGWCFCTFHL
ncbi:MAG: hypothetical protein H7836_01895 [Magnetococcus sp. YQC-3]